MSDKGYNLYMGQQLSQVRNELKCRLRKGEKLKSNAAQVEISKRWKNLPECSRNMWNNKGAAKAKPIVVCKTLK